MKALEGHPHIVELIAAYIYRSKAWIVMRYYAGGDSFQHFVNGDGEATEQGVAQVIKDLLVALDFCHG